MALVLFASIAAAGLAALAVLANRPEPKRIPVRSRDPRQPRR